MTIHYLLLCYAIFTFNTKWGTDPNANFFKKHAILLKYSLILIC